MKHSDSITNLLRSLISAQLKMASGVAKDALNASFSTQYATLGAVIEATKAVLLAENITVIQLPGEYIDGKVSVTTLLCHGSGEWMEGVSSAPLEFADSQGIGSAVTYLRRYALTAMLGLYQCDDDAVAASPRAVVNAARPISKGNSGAKANETPPGVDPMEATAAKWRANIANAPLERLILAKETALTTFTGALLKEILALIERHRVAAQVADPFQL